MERYTKKLISLDEITLAKMKALAEAFSMSQSALIRWLVKEAEKKYDLELQRYNEFMSNWLKGENAER